MNLEHYRQRLLAEQQEASTRLERAVAGVSEPSDGVPHDTADESSNSELRYRQLAQAHAARTLLNQVRGALDRIDNGTFGRCAEDGEPIEEARLEAVPWAAYCERHDRRPRPDTALIVKGEGR
jgi:DnaK suppressor protein